MNPTLVRDALDDLMNAQESLKGAFQQAEDAKDSNMSSAIMDTLNHLSGSIGRLNTIVASLPQEDTTVKVSAKKS